MQAMLIMKTKQGYALLEISQDKIVGSASALDIAGMSCFNELDDSYSYKRDGALSAIRAHFADEPAEPLKVAA